MCACVPAYTERECNKYSILVACVGVRLPWFLVQGCMHVACDMCANDYKGLSTDFFVFVQNPNQPTVLLLSALVVGLITLLSI